MEASKKHIELIVSKQIFLKSIFYKNNFINFIKIFSNGPHISMHIARKYAAHLRKFWRQMDFQSYSYKEWTLDRLGLSCHTTFITRPNFTSPTIFNFISKSEFLKWKHCLNNFLLLIFPWGIWTQPQTSDWLIQVVVFLMVVIMKSSNHLKLILLYEQTPKYCWNHFICYFFSKVHTVNCRKRTIWGTKYLALFLLLISFFKASKAVKIPKG